MVPLDLPYGSITVTVLVCSPAEFDEVCGAFLATGIKFNLNHIEVNRHPDIRNVLRQLKVIPLVKRGPLSEPVFERYGVTGAILSALIEGTPVSELLSVNERLRALLATASERN